MKFTKRQKIYGTIGLVIVVLFFGTKFYIRHERIRVALEFGHLAELPDNSKNITVDTQGSMFSRTFWLTYEATQQEIDNWIKKSQKLDKKEKKIRRTNDYKIFQKDPKTGKLIEMDFSKPIRQNGQPDWFNPDESSTDVDLFEVSFPKEALHGKIWVDRKNNKVFIKTSYS